MAGEHSRDAASDVLLGYGPLVTLLVGAHLLAFVVWVILLAVPQKQKSTVKAE